MVRKTFNEEAEVEKEVSKTMNIKRRMSLVESGEQKSPKGKLHVFFYEHESLYATFCGD